MGNIQESPVPYRTPEGLTYNQEILAGMLFDVQVQGPAYRLHFNEDGTHRMYKVDNRITSPLDFAQHQEEHAFKHHEKNPYSPLAPVKINLRNLPFEVLDQIGTVYSEIPENGILPDICTGIPDAGTALARSYSDKSEIPLEEVFVKKEDEQSRRIVASGVSGDGKFLRIIDDTATGGESKFEAIAAAESMGFSVSDITVLIDRGQGAKELIESQGYSYRFAFTLMQLLQFGLRTQRISEEQFNKAQSYLLSQKQTS